MIYSSGREKPPGCFESDSSFLISFADCSAEIEGQGRWHPPASHRRWTTMLPGSPSCADGHLACASRYDCGSSSPRPFQSLREVTETSKGYVADLPHLPFVHPATWDVSRILSVEILARRVSRLDALSENVPSTKLQCYLDRAFRILARLAIAQSVS